MKTKWIIPVLVVLSSPYCLNAQETVTFKLGTFADGAEPNLGLVLDDSLVVDITQADDALPGGQAVFPDDMKQLIVRYAELRPRLHAIAAAAASDAFDIVSFVSHNLTVNPGDVVAMGTPSGVGVARDPQVFMKPGDVAACTVESIGTLTNPVAGH